MFKKAKINRSETLKDILYELRNLGLADCFDWKKLKKKMQEDNFLVKLANGLKTKIVYLPDPDIRLIVADSALRPIPVDIRDQACQQFGGFKHDDKIVDITRRPSPNYDYPNIVIGVSFGSDPPTKNKEVLWYKSTNPNSQGMYFYIQPKDIKNHKKIS